MAQRILDLAQRLPCRLQGEPHLRVYPCLLHIDEDRDRKERKQKSGHPKDAHVSDPIQKDQASNHTNKRAEVSDSDPEATHDSLRLRRTHDRKRRVVENQAGLEEVVGDDEEAERNPKPTHAERRSTDHTSDGAQLEERQTPACLVGERPEDRGTDEDQEHGETVRIPPGRVGPTHVENPQRQIQRHDVHGEDRVRQIVESP